MFHLINSQLPLIFSLLIVLVVAKILGEVAEHFGQPSMIGEVLAGVILGPSLLNVVQNTMDLKVVAELGIFLLIVMAGLEIQVEEIRNSIRGKNIWIALLGFVIPFIGGALTGYAFHYNNTFSIILGLCIAITALPVSIRILMDMGKLNTEVGRKIISAAIFNDIVSLLVLGVILDFNDESKRLEDIVYSSAFTIGKISLFVLFLVAAYRMFKLVKSKVSIVNPKVNEFLHHLRGKESLFALVIVFVLVFSSISEAMGLHFIVGAFFGAILLPRSIFVKGDFTKVKESTSGITMGFLAPVFFATLGIAIDVTSLGNLPLLFMVLGISFITKILGGYLGGRMAGLNGSTSFTIGLGLNARGIMELVIANIALQRGFIDVSVFSILVVMALLTTIFTPFFLQYGFHVIERNGKRVHTSSNRKIR
ncbi:MAG: cation:proton antiporter [Bacteroidetes bacterium]|nr:cation:proton antiporter [Bacteroidota bacterium]